MASISDNGIVLSEYQKKLKTMKKKFFVLYKETTNTAARLEYYDTEKKFLQNTEPKRVILLKTCFNINRRLDTKHKFVLVLSSREGGFGIVLNSETDLIKWLDNLLSIQRDNSSGTDHGYTTYENVWQVVVQKKGMSINVGITGSYHCCLTSKSLTFICIGPEKLPNGDERVGRVEILLTTIRRCGHASPQSIFYMELGRQSVLGSGELWMETEDAAIAKDMHDKILSAMSVKSESNMNLLNVYKGNPDLGNEPMRKRSSSANEASKPINVLQKRQNPVEIRNSFSPQYNNYGRERCDSLPTRNRTLSECSNQTYIAIKRGHRCNTISGTRPNSSQRYSDSPPTNSAMKCSESVESSISMDEMNDKGSFDAYRINSRTSKGMIPEENIDDDVCDNRKSSQINENFENYISMSPIKSTYENLNLNQLNHCAGSNTLLSVSNGTFTIDFPEHSSEKLGNDADADNRCERPSRAYSIGSKVEHTKLTKLLGNISEVDNTSPRVRAYSVGSKSKIPRCDIQRGVLFSKLKKGHNHKGSICNVDVQTCNEIGAFHSPKEIKSTSAPLLNLRNYVNPVRMSDLMEIDFSNVTTATTISQQENCLNNFQVPKVMQCENVTQRNISIANPCSNANIKNADLPRYAEFPMKPNFIASSDSGYLEMKPVGKVDSSYKQPQTLEDQMEKLVLQNPTTSQLRTDQDKLRHFSNFCYEVPNANADLSDTKKTTNININIAENLNKSHFKKDEYTKLEQISMENTNLNFALDISRYATVGRKLIHSISNEDYTKHLNKSNAADTKEVGYQILQIKSDSSLISKKQNQRPTYKPQCGRQFLQEDVNKVDEKESISKQSTKYNIFKNESNILNEDALSDCVLSKDETVLPSNLCEYELYYASLDLPQCSGQVTTKCLNKASCDSPPVPICLETNSLYAKIDFDQSDSSSASSKICNI